MGSLVSALQRFNRKERNWLIRDALGAGADVLCPNFRKRLADVLREYDSAISVPPHAWWTTDFHIDWLIGALTIFAEGENDSHRARPNQPHLVTGSQQDLDLLIAWDTTLILVEAKGVGSWTGIGTTEKLKRLKGLPKSLFEGLRPYLVFTSPDKAGVPQLDWPEWIVNKGKPVHMQMKPPLTGFPLLQIERCETASDGKVKRKAAGDREWRIKEAKLKHQESESDFA